VNVEEREKLDTLSTLEASHYRNQLLTTLERELRSAPFRRKGALAVIMAVADLERWGEAVGAMQPHGI
jgi:hypothetical protein